MQKNYEVVMIVEYTKVAFVTAESESEAKEIAEKRLRKNQKTLLKQGYSIGDVEIVETKESAAPTRTQLREAHLKSLQSRVAYL